MVRRGLSLCRRLGTGFDLMFNLTTFKDITNTKNLLRGLNKTLPFVKGVTLFESSNDFRGAIAKGVISYRKDYKN